jgi:serine/threonine protein kinase
MQTEVLAVLEGREATVLLQADGIAVRKLKHRSGGVRMRDAAKLLQISRHPHLVRIVKVHDGDIYMEAMAASLQQHAPAAQAFSFERKLSIALSIARGICHLHLNGMDHGDLCPSNILLAGETLVKLSDFYSDHTGARRTAAYASPEVVRGPQPVMCAADVWAFACCLLFLEGVEPFHGFEEDQSKLYYLGLHQCVAFRERDVCTQFSLHGCSYAPARHIADTAWVGILAATFVPEHARLCMQRVCDRLTKISKTHGARVPLGRLNK